MFNIFDNKFIALGICRRDDERINIRKRRNNNEKNYCPNDSNEANSGKVEIRLDYTNVYL